MVDDFSDKGRKEPTLELTAREVPPRIEAPSAKDGPADADFDDEGSGGFRGLWLVGVAVAGILIGSFATSALGVFNSARSGLVPQENAAAAPDAAADREAAGKAEAELYALRAEYASLQRSSEEKIAALEEKVRELESTNERVRAGARQTTAAPPPASSAPADDGPTPYTPPSDRAAAAAPNAGPVPRNRPAASGTPRDQAPGVAASSADVAPLPPPPTNDAYAVPPPPGPRYDEPRVVRGDELASTPRNGPPRPSADVPGQRSLAGRPVLRDWIVVEVRGGRAVIDGGFGAYQVEPGSFHPELGMVEAIDWRGDRWIVVTQRGVIDSGRR